MTDSKKISILVKKSFYKDFRKIPEHYQIRIKEKIDQLRENPLLEKQLKGSLGHIRRIRIGIYRLGYVYEESELTTETRLLRGHIKALSIKERVGTRLGVSKERGMANSLISLNLNLGFYLTLSYFPIIFRKSVQVTAMVCAAVSTAEISRKWEKETRRNSSGFRPSVSAV